ncbi:MAG: GEVED domain-containing protein [Chitinophagaceae bacterium]
MDFLAQDPTYITLTKAQTQHFAFNKNRVTITHNYTISNAVGENALNTAETGSYGTGEDVQFIGNGIITISFQNAVQNVKFSLYDIDALQKVTVTAVNNASSIPVTTLAKVSGTLLTIAGSNTNSASATAGAGYIANNISDGTVNVTIDGPVTTITLTITNSTIVQTGNGNNKTTLEDGSFWLSDISACTNATPFPTGYYAVSKPFTGQPGYVLAAIDDSIIIVDPSNGKARFLFRDPMGNNINSVGYDPYNKFLYYTYSLTGANKAVNPNDKSIQKYDVNTGLISTVISDVTTLGIPLYTSGVESGGAAFYDGAFYLGIEGVNGDESKIWRIDFDASFNPIFPARQVYAMVTDFHDWSDFVISNGILYDFNGKSTTTSTRYESIDHISLQTGATLASFPFATLNFIPRQASVDWTEKLFNVGTALSASTGTIVPYANGAITAAQQYTITKGTATPTGSWGDAGEAFRPKADFGDAPSSFDPDPMAPAMHELDINLRLGNTVDIEWNKPDLPGLNADLDGDDEDGLTFVRIMNMRSGAYQTDVNVYNNTGAAATVAAWVDFNGDGVFQSNEGITKSVASSASMQSVSLYWTGILANLPDNSRTYLRIRITSASNNMTTSNPTGYFSNGEVEDYYLLVNATPLDVTLKDFSAKKVTDNKITLAWNIVDEKAQTFYELQKSVDGINWKNLFERSASQDNSSIHYTYDDLNTIQAHVYYRLRLSAPNKNDAYSNVQKIMYNSSNYLTVSPNPASMLCKIKINSMVQETAHIYLLDVGGATVFQKTVTLLKGANSILLPAQDFQAGVYTLRVLTASANETKRVSIQKK